MEKILITLSVPALEKEYDILVPAFLEVRTLLPLLVKAVIELSGHRYLSSAQEVLCSKEREQVLSAHETLSSSGIRSGDQLVLL